MNVPIWIWCVTLLGLTAIITADLVVATRRSHVTSTKETSLWVILYVTLACIFGVAVLVGGGPTRGAEFFAGYITEYSLSVDNLFVFVIIISKFAVPREQQHKVILIGIVLSLILRGIFIGAGAAAIHAFTWMFYIFGAFLIYTAVKVAMEGNKEPEFPDNIVVRGIQRIFPMTPSYDGGRLITTVNDRRVMTPLVIVVVALGTANVIFALDSIPAIFGLTQNAFIVFTANAFALMGLRQLYFLLDRLLSRLTYLSHGLAIVLGFIGVKLIIEALHGYHIEEIRLPVPNIGIAASLGFIILVLGITTAISLLKGRSVPSDSSSSDDSERGAGTHV
jgi:tellurite resistance protein TerC